MDGRVALYHHIQGLTEGVERFADELRQAGHTVHAPDVFDGRTFATMEEAFAFVQEAGDTLTPRPTKPRTHCPRGWCTPASRGASAPHSGSHRRAPAPVGRFSMKLASPSRANTPSARGPTGCRFRSTARRMTSSSPTRAISTLPANWSPRAGPHRAELFVYPGDEHLFIDSSLPSYDADARRHSRRSAHCSSSPCRCREADDANQPADGEP